MIVRWKRGSVVAVLKERGDVSIGLSHSADLEGRGLLWRATGEVVVEKGDVADFYLVMECIQCRYPAKACRALGVDVELAEVTP
jgi:hypothetical protein